MSSQIHARNPNSPVERDLLRQCGVSMDFVRSLASSSALESEAGSKIFFVRDAGSNHNWA